MFDFGIERMWRSHRYAKTLRLSFRKVGIRTFVAGEGKPCQRQWTLVKTFLRED